MHTIEVDFEVLKALMARRETEAVTYNDVVRRLLRLDEGGRATAETEETFRKAVLGAGGWVSQGVEFPERTEFRADYKGTTYTGRVEAGRLVVAGKGYDSPSAAAAAITNGSVNGWIFWECRRPGETGWRVIKALRARQERRTRIPMAVRTGSIGTAVTA